MPKGYFIYVFKDGPLSSTICRSYGAGEGRKDSLREMHLFGWRKAAYRITFGEFMHLLMIGIGINFATFSAFAVQNNPCHPCHPCQKIPPLIKWTSGSAHINLQKTCRPISCMHFSFALMQCPAQSKPGQRGHCVKRSCSQDDVAP